MVVDQVWQAVVLGILQGLTEFLPISSSAHLLLLPWLLDWQHFGLVFDVLLHGGTLLAVLLYFRRDWKALILNFLGRFPGGGRPASNQMDLAILVGTVPAVLVALCFRSWVEEYARTPEVTVFTLSFFGFVLWWADCKGKQTCSLRDINVWTGLLLGIAQSMALIPGVSRSGITITAALLLGFNRADSARVSFLLGGPIVALAALNSLLELAVMPLEDDGLAWVSLMGLIASFVTGVLCIKFFLRFLKKRTFLLFVLYRFGLAGVILLFVLLY